MNNYVSSSVTLYKILGSWPLQNESRLFGSLRYLYGLCFIGATITFIAFQCADVYYQWGEWEFVSEICSISCGLFIFFAKVCVFYRHRPEILRLVVRMDSYVRKLLVERDAEKVKLSEMHEMRAKYIGQCYHAVMLSALATLILWPLVTFLYSPDNSQRRLILRAHLPFSLNSTGIYFGVILAESFVGTIMTMHSLAFDLFFIGCIIFATARMRILQYSLETLGKGNDERCNVECTRSTTIAIQLGKCVDEHKELIEFCRILDSILSLILFGIFFTYTMLICSIGFNVMLLGINLKLVRIGAYLGTEMMQALVYYWHGDVLTSESLKVSDAAFFGEWYRTSKTHRKSITVIMSRSQRPILLTAGKLSIVSLQAFLSIIGNGYSYFAVMKNVYDRKGRRSDDDVDEDDE